MKQTGARNRLQLVVLMALALFGVAGMGIAAHATTISWAQFVDRLPGGYFGVIPNYNLGIQTNVSVNTSTNANVVPVTNCPRGVPCCPPYAAGGINIPYCSPIVSVTCHTAQSTIVQGQGLGCGAWLVMMQSVTTSQSGGQQSATFDVYRYYENKTISLIQQVTLSPNQTPPPIVANATTNATATGVIGPGEARVCLPQQSQRCLDIYLYSTGYNQNGQEWASLSLTGTYVYHWTPPPCKVCVGVTSNSNGSYYCGPRQGSGQAWPSYVCYPHPLPVNVTAATTVNGTASTQNS